MLPTFRSLRRWGVLGLNARNLLYIQRYNRRRFYPNADSKVRTKRLAEEHNIPVPPMYGLVSYIGELRKFDQQYAQYHEFVVKPEHGSGGNGVLVLRRDADGALCLPSGEQVRDDKLKLHIANTLYGLYSLGGQPDRAIIEYRIQFDPVFERIAYHGVPDVRIIVFKGIPVMAMMRLPTKQSSGRANLHQGAIGVGIELGSGVTRGGIAGTQRITTHPDTGGEISGITVPRWTEMMSIACRAADMFSLQFFGVDIVLDKERGPLLLEVNVRPGLAIQLANRVGLRNRLALIDRHADRFSTPEDRMDFAMRKVAGVSRLL